MIVRMVKYAFIASRDERGGFLEAIQRLGMVDVTMREWEPTSEERASSGLLERYGRAVDGLGVAGGTAYPSAIEALEAWEGARARMAEIASETSRLDGLLVQFKDFGEFEPEKIREVEAFGVDVFELAGAERVELPELSPQAMRARLAELAGERTWCEKNLARASASRGLMEVEMSRLSAELDLSRAIKSGREAVEGHVVVIEAWARARDARAVEELVENFPGVVCLKALPTPEDEVPVELKNNKFAAPFEFIGDLYAKPKYGSMDLTRWFAPFFMLFFGMCMGDFGYGTLIFLGGLGLVLWGGGSMKEIGRLTMWCGGAAIVVGFIMGGLFGVSIVDWPVMTPLRRLFIDSNSMFYVAIGVGIFQVMFAMVLNIVTRSRAFGLKYALADIGWLLVMVAGICGFALGMSTAILCVVGLGAVLMLFFNSPGKNVFVNFGSGLWATFNRVTGLLGDALSYIRLFAIGLSGGILAQVFNTIAVQISPDIPVVGQVVTLLILLIGHSLNLFLSTLSAIVHPLRLTFVEFFNNAGFEASEREFKPLRK